jgi:hypothetical protein
MLEVLNTVSVWPIAGDSGPSLNSVEGVLISISITVDACDLEALLDSLAQLDYPINPQIYHRAAAVYRYADGKEEAKATTIVEFPAYAGWLPGIRRIVESYGFSPTCVHSAPMLDELHDDSAPHPAPEGAPYAEVKLIKHAELTVCA